MVDALSPADPGDSRAVPRVLWGRKQERFWPFRPMTFLPRIRKAFGVHNAVWMVNRNRNFGGWYVTVPGLKACFHVGRQPIPRRPADV